MSPLYLSIEPRPSETRLCLVAPQLGPRLKARLPTPPLHPRSLGMFLESLAAWHQRPLSVVLDADALDVQMHPERWAQLLGELDPLRITVEWVAPPERAKGRDRFLGTLGDFRRAHQLLGHATTGLKR
jgi:hypothetical protein